MPIDDGGERQVKQERLRQIASRAARRGIDAVIARLTAVLTESNDNRVFLQSLSRRRFEIAEDVVESIVEQVNFRRKNQ